MFVCGFINNNPRCRSRILEPAVLIYVERLLDGTRKAGIDFYLEVFEGLKGSHAYVVAYDDGTTLTHYELGHLVRWPAYPWNMGS